MARISSCRVELRPFLACLSRILGGLAAHIPCGDGLSNENALLLHLLLEGVLSRSLRLLRLRI